MLVKTTLRKLLMLGLIAAAICAASVPASAESGCHDKDRQAARG